jgi:hypothetical protein
VESSIECARQICFRADHANSAQPTREIRQRSVAQQIRDIDQAWRDRCASELLRFVSAAWPRIVTARSLAHRVDFACSRLSAAAKLF